MKKQARRFISVALTVMVTFTLTVGTGFKQAKAVESGLSNSDRASVAEELDRVNFENNKSEEASASNENKTIDMNPNEVVRVIVQLMDKPTAVKEAASLEKIQAAQVSVKAKVKALEDVSIRNTYTNVLNGFSMTIKRGEIDKVKAMAGVKSVTEATIFYKDMTYSKALTQAYTAWANPGVKGEGMVVSIIDSGIDPNHKDMRLTDDSTGRIKGKPGQGKYYTAKIPYAYNFADKSDDIVDTGDAHGMHVAGIVGANCDGDEGKDAIKGVAPECQLLAMKVFSNDPNAGGAGADDIVAAIEESVNQGADVINMSLGSTASFQDPNDPEQEAIRNATNKGVVVVVSAGNDQYSTAPNKLAGVYDTGLVGTPGIAKESLQVASYENSDIVTTSFEYEINGAKDIMLYATTGAPKDPAVVFKGQKLQLIDCGQGGVLPADYKGKDLNGKIAVVEWGHGQGSVALRTAAMKAGAAGALIYGPAGDEAMHNMTEDGTLIPAAWVAHSDGVKLIRGIAGGITVGFDGKIGKEVNPNAKDMSDFSSWGPTPSLEFKPEITAPGGNIWSTVNDGKYESMSGTSMASPHAAGSEALILQGIKEKNLKLAKGDLANFSKITSINTAETLMDKSHPSVPYSPRRQGAGMIQIQDAIKNSVTITDKDGSATVALKEIGKVHTFPLNLKNYDSKPVTYDISNIGEVLTEQSKKAITTMSYDEKIEGATIVPDKTSVTVLGNETATVNITITLPDSFKTEQFVEGFVKFSSTTNQVLVVPYIGFYGDWSKQNIIDGPAWDNTKTKLSKTTMYELKKDDKIKSFGEDQQKIAISPDGDFYKDNLFPSLTFLRNAKSMSVQVLDSNKNAIYKISDTKNIKKNVFAKDNGYKQSMRWMWDGKIPNTATGKMEVAADGQYYIDYSAKVDLATAKEQHLRIPVKVDLTAPEVALKSSTNTKTTSYKLEWTVTDKLSGEMGTSLVYLNDVYQKGIKITNTDGVYSCDLTLQPEKINKVEISSADNAFNMFSKIVKVNCYATAPDITVTGVEDGKVYNTNVTPVFKANDATVTATLNGKEYKGTEITLDGKYELIVTAVDLDKHTSTEIRNFTIDKTSTPPVTAPVITVEGVEDGKVYKTNVTPIITVNEGTFTATLNSKEYKGVEITEDGKYVLIVTATTTNAAITTNATSSNSSSKTINFTIAKNVTPPVTAPVIIVTGVEDGKVYKTNVTPIITVNEGTFTATLNSKEYKGVEITEEGKYALMVTATTTGAAITTNSAITTNIASNTSTKSINFTIDKTDPIITVTGVEDGKKYNTKVTPIIKVNEGTFTATLNDKAYLLGDIIVDGKYKLIVNAVDLAGNTSTKTINFTIAKTSPVIISGGGGTGNYVPLVTPPVVTPPVVTPPVVTPPDVTPIVKSGWNLIDGKWYYGNSDGTKKTGWILSGAKWYYLGSDTVMKTGWVSVNNKWYFLENSGAMKMGWALVNNKWYFLENSGAMKTGWTLVDNNWYYLYDTGEMAADTTVEGYRVGSNGAWIQ